MNLVLLDNLGFEIIFSDSCNNDEVLLVSPPRPGVPLEDRVAKIVLENKVDEQHDNN